MVEIYLSPNFTMREASYSNRATKEGWDNTLPSIYYTNAQNLAKYILEPIRNHFNIPFSPLSWYRCERLNDAIGGAHGSQHCLAQAADILITKIPLITLVEYIRDNLQFDQVILEPEWVHCSYKKDNNRMEVLRNAGKDEAGKIIYLEGLL